MSKTYYFRTDNTPPTITLNKLTNNTVINAGASINFTINDLSTIQSVMYNWNGITNTTGILSNWILYVIAPATQGNDVITIYEVD